jgi:hypothetical protein
MYEQLDSKTVFSDKQERDGEYEECEVTNERELYDDTKLDDTETFDLDTCYVCGESGRYAGV